MLQMNEKKTEKKQDQIRGSMIGGAIGDALGYPVEFLSERDFLHLWSVRNNRLCASPWEGFDLG